MAPRSAAESRLARAAARWRCSLRDPPARGSLLSGVFYFVSGLCLQLCEPGGVDSPTLLSPLLAAFSFAGSLPLGCRLSGVGVGRARKYGEGKKRWQSFCVQLISVDEVFELRIM